MPTDYNTGGTMYAQSMLVGVNNSQAIVFGADGTLKFVTNPFGASPVEALSISAAGVPTLTAGVTNTYVVRCEAATDKVRTITLVGGVTTSIGTCA